MKHLWPTTILVGAIALTGCSDLIPLHKAGTVVNDDGHSTTTLLIGGDKGDPQGCNQNMAMGAEFTSYKWNGRTYDWRTDPVQLRPVTNPALGCTLAPAMFQAASTAGGAWLIRGGQIAGAQIQGFAEYAAAGVQAKGAVQAAGVNGQAAGQAAVQAAAAGRPIVNTTNLNYAAGGAGGAANAAANAASNASAAATATASAPFPSQISVHLVNP